MRQSRIIFNNFGLLSTFFYLIIAFFQRIFFFRIYRILNLEIKRKSLIPSQRATDNGNGIKIKNIKVCALGELEQELLANLPEYDINQEFLNQVRGPHERCFAVFSSSKVVSYGWFGRGFIHIINDFQIHPGPGMIYLHKVFTLPEFRGQHLLWRLIHGFIEQANFSCDRLLALVEIQNFSSQQGFRRAGFRSVGWLVLIDKGNWNFYWSNKKVRRLGVKFSRLK